MQRHLDAENLAPDADWEGNTAAFTCPKCGNVYIVSGGTHDRRRAESEPGTHRARFGKRKCPNCGKSEAWVRGGRLSGGEAGIEW